VTDTGGPDQVRCWWTNPVTELADDGRRRLTQFEGDPQADKRTGRCGRRRLSIDKYEAATKKQELVELCAKLQAEHPLPTLGNTKPIWCWRLQEGRQKARRRAGRELGA